MNKKSLIMMILMFITFETIAQQYEKLPKLSRNSINIIVLNDSGAKVDSQRVATAEVAASIARIIKKNNISFIAIPGDIIHDNGVKSVDDPEWDYKVEQIFRKEKELSSVPWYVVPGNHEYNGNPQAIIDYAKTKSWWKFSSLYYQVNKRIPRSKESVSFFFMDTFPMVESKAISKKNIPDGYLDSQKSWADSVMKICDSKWKIVFGHHPVYAHTNKKISEREDMKRNLLPLLDKYCIDYYICGHIHNFQYIIPDDSHTKYIVNTSGARIRIPQPIEGTVFCEGTVGFSVFSISENNIEFYFLNKNGDVIYHGYSDSF